MGQTAQRKQPGQTEPKGQSAPDRIFTRDFNLIVALNFLLFLAFQFFPSALPVYAASIGVPSQYLGLISGALTIAALVVRPLVGVAVDKYGRKGLLLGGLAVMLVCTAAYALCPPFIPLIIIRFIQGLGWGATTTAASTVASDVLPRSRFGEGMGYFGLSISVALAIGPATGLTLLDAYGITVLSVIGSALLVATLVLGVITKTLPVTALGKGAPAGTRGGLFERAALVPAVIMGLMTCTYGAIVTFLALTAAERGIANVTGFFIVYALAAIVSRPLIGRFIDRHGFQLATGAGIILMLTGLVAITLAQSLAVLLVAGALFGLGQGTLQTTLQTEAIVRSPAGRNGAANATFYVGFDGGIGLGAIVGGGIVGVLGYTGMFASMCALPVVAFLIFLKNRS